MNNFHANRAIQSLDLGDVQNRAEAKYNWLEPVAAEAIKRYRIFLYLQSSQEGYYLIPPKTVDLVWCVHLEDIEAYVAGTTIIFGKPLNHYTTTLMYRSSKLDRQLHFLMTKALFLSEFGIDINDDRTPNEWNIDPDLIERYHKDMMEKFAHTSRPGFFFLNYHNRIGPDQ